MFQFRTAAISLVNIGVTKQHHVMRVLGCRAHQIKPRRMSAERACVHSNISKMVNPLDYWQPAHFCYWSCLKFSSKTWNEKKGFDSQQMPESGVPTSSFLLRGEGERRRESLIFFLCCPPLHSAPMVRTPRHGGEWKLWHLLISRSSGKDAGRIMRLPGQAGIKVDGGYDRRLLHWSGLTAGPKTLQ